MSSPRKVGMTTVADVRARCNVDPVTNCWIWHGGMRKRDGVQQPAMHAFDHERGEKRTMTGPRAVWNIAHGAAPLPGYVVFRACCNRLCLNPVHLREAKTLADVGRHRRLSGVLKGNNTEARRANLRKAQAAAGVVVTPQHIVDAIQQAPKTITGQALARQFELSVSSVSRIRRRVRVCDMERA